MTEEEMDAIERQEFERTGFDLELYLETRENPEHEGRTNENPLPNRITDDLDD